MIKLNRTTEYGLIALRHMSRKGGPFHSGSAAAASETLTSAREISDHYGFPFEITAKTLQRLKDSGLIHSAQGARGGYTLQRSLEQISLSEFLVAMEGPQAVVACASAAGVTAGVGCEYSPKCEIKSVMSDLNQKIAGFLSSIRLADIAGVHGPGVIFQSFSAQPVAALNKGVQK